MGLQKIEKGTNLHVINDKGKSLKVISLYDDFAYTRANEFIRDYKKEQK
jgi:hypothetical protein